MELHYSYHQHGEEDSRPGGGTWQLENHLRVREEDKSWSALHHVGHLCALLLGDVAQDREGHTAGQQTRHRVHYTSDERVPGGKQHGCQGCDSRDCITEWFGLTVRLCSMYSLAAVLYVLT